MSVEDALRSAGLPVADYAERLASAGVAGTYSHAEANDLAEAAKCAKLPLGHRLKLVGVLRALPSR